MRIKTLLAALAALAGVALALPDQASAGFLHRHAAEGSSKDAVVSHRVYRPRHHHVYYGDPYAYRYEPRGYYPYYNSRYWVPARCFKRCKVHYKLRPYYKAWGYPKRNYHHRKWHARHHGVHRRHHW